MAHPREFAEGRSIGIIMDGNGRWAKKRGLPRTAGHAAGAETFRTIAYRCRDLGIPYLTVYAFSTENWKRPVEEVSAIMDLLRKYLLEALEKMEKDGFRIRFFGDLEALPPELRTDPDLIIRPSGELRLSNFLPWQSAYAEFYFTDVLWPDFSPAVLDAALVDFQRRQRRFGGV